MKTTEEIESLKKAWMFDPCFDLAEAEGFEEHRAELMAFQEQYFKEEEAINVAQAIILRNKWNQLELNQSFNINPDVDVIRVPNGWVINQRFYEHMGHDVYDLKTVTSVFIPAAIP
jgi:hypothetical protein